MEKQEQNGITLIALVITIIVLLVLAGVSISLIVGNNGVLSQASNSIIANRDSKAREEVQMAWASVKAIYWTEWAQNSSKNLEDYLNKDLLNTYLAGTGIITEELSYDNEKEAYLVKYKANDQGQDYEFYVTLDGVVTGDKVLAVTNETVDEPGQITDPEPGPVQPIGPLSDIISADDAFDIEGGFWIDAPSGLNLGLKEYWVPSYSSAYSDYVLCDEIDLVENPGHEPNFNRDYTYSGEYYNRDGKPTSYAYLVVYDKSGTYTGEVIVSAINKMNFTT